MKLRALAAGAGLLTLALAGCNDADTSAEEAGEAVDSAYEESVQGVENLSDGAAENAGEQVDRAVQDAAREAEDAGDAVEDAADDAVNN